MHRESIFMITRRYLCSSRAMHCEKISCLAESYASREDFILCRNYVSREDFIPRRNYASREDIFMLRRNLCITGRYSYPEIMHHGKIFMPCKKSCTARGGIVHLKGYVYPSNKEYIEDYIANTRHKFYLFYVKPIELTLNVEKND